MARHPRLLAALAVAAVAWLCAVGAGAGAAAPLHWVDERLLGETVKDAWGRLRHGEDWQAAAVLPPGQDYRWLTEAGRPVLVAHALGEAGLAGQNSLDAMRRSLARGVRLMEIDIWLDEHGLLRCHHGPQAPRGFVPGDCELQSALRLAAERQAWLVLDIKTEFAATGDAVIDAVAGQAASVRLVFQLYRHEHVARFAAWTSRTALAGPILTAYLSHRSVRHLAHHAARIGVRALTVPLTRATALGRPPAGVAVLVHPVHDCAAVHRAEQLPVEGMYVQSALVEAIGRGCRT